jgi:hypothetical protein
MKTAKSWFKELFYALKTLPRNPYIRYRLEKIAKPRILLYIIIVYFILTITHIAINWKTFSSPFSINGSL